MATEMYKGKVAGVKPLGTSTRYFTSEDTRSPPSRGVSDSAPITTERNRNGLAHGSPTETWDFEVHPNPKMSEARMTVVVLNGHLS